MDDVLEVVDGQGRLHAVTPWEFLDALTYRSYCHHRQRNPQIPPAEWSEIFPAWARFEQRYQQEAADGHGHQAD